MHTTFCFYLADSPRLRFNFVPDFSPYLVPFPVRKFNFFFMYSPVWRGFRCGPSPALPEGLDRCPPVCLIFSVIGNRGTCSGLPANPAVASLRLSIPPDFFSLFVPPYPSRFAPLLRLEMFEPNIVLIFHSFIFYFHLCESAISMAREQSRLSAN